MSTAMPAAGAEPRTLAPLGRRVAPIVHNRALGRYGLIGVLDPVPAAPWPGQFYMLATAEGWGGGSDERPYLARACSVARVRPRTDGLLLEFLLDDVGPGTNRLLAAGPGQELWLTGPLGLGFTPPDPQDRALLVGGGAGVAPLVIWHDWLAVHARTALALFGFRGAGYIEAAELVPGAQVATDDGSVGHRGPVTALLEGALDDAGPACVYACGPPAMLAAVRAISLARGVPAQLALEAPMACGYGACYGCVVATTDGYARVCVDGPVFEARRLASLEGLGHDGEAGP